MFVFGVLDIETSKYIPNTVIKNSKIVENKNKIPSLVWLNYGYINEYYTNKDKQTNRFFSSWDELDKILSLLNYKYFKTGFIIYVHNLSYEADFLFKNISKPSFLLCNKNHNVITCTLEKYPSLTFKCSLMLSQKSLRKIGDEMGFPKLDSEYRMLLPTEKPTTEELNYNLRDCDIVAKYIRLELKEYKTLQNIPLTNTGRVRKDLAKEYNLFYNKNSKECEWDLMPDEDCFEALVNAYWGAITISNPKYTNCIIDNVISYDETSEYPYALLNNDYPYTIKRLYNFSNNDINKYKFWIAKIKIKEISKKYDWSWLSAYKFHDFNFLNSEFFNGKLQYCKEIILTLTNIDFELIKQTYDFISYEIVELYVCDKFGSIPKCISNIILKYAEEKTKLKNKLKTIDENNSEYLSLNMDYLRVKGKLNAIYGMFVQSIQETEYTIDEDFIWHEIKKPYIKENKHLKRNFLFGIYCTAYARRDWIKFVLTNCKYDFIYGDTDSCKFPYKEKVINTNEPLKEEYRTEFTKNFGVFDFDGKYDRFITFGAKKYAYEIIENDKINCNCTIAGLPKKEPNFYCNKIEEFTLGKRFDFCKKAHIYLYNNQAITLENDTNYVKEYTTFTQETFDFIKENNITDKGGCAIFETSYTLNITDDDKEIINNYVKAEKNRKMVFI